MIICDSTTGTLAVRGRNETWVEVDRLEDHNEKNVFVVYPRSIVRTGFPIVRPKQKSPSFKPNNKKGGRRRWYEF